MAALETLKYRAFLSYSHRDSAAAKRLHSRLEGFRIDKDLVGRATPMGPIPKQLRPIFRDRHDFDAGGTLGEQTISAIDSAGAMILLASPASASSRPVNDEVRLFCERHPERPLIPLILDGEPGNAERECFPPALREQGDMPPTHGKAVTASNWRWPRWLPGCWACPPMRCSAAPSATAAAALAFVMRSSECLPFSASPPPAVPFTPGTS